MSHAPSPQPNAGLIRRLLAIVYDTLLLLGVAFAYGIIIWTIRKIAGADLESAPGPVIGTLILFFLWVTLAGYYVLCWTKRGQTLGMKSWRLRVEKIGGGCPSVQQSWLRCILAPVSAGILGLGYIWCWFDKSHSCWHDQWTGTCVKVQPKESKRKQKNTV